MTADEAQIFNLKEIVASLKAEIATLRQDRADWRQQVDVLAQANTATGLRLATAEMENSTLRQVLVEQVDQISTLRQQLQQKK